jgi:hypothetical protein
MSDASIFQGDRIREAGEYFCSLVAAGGEVDEDTQQLMSAFRAMAWAVEQLREHPGNEQTQRRLIQECPAIACHLLDKRCAALWNKTE